MPAVAHLESPDPACRDLDLIRGEPRRMRPERILVHAAGLGGQTTFLAVEVLA